MEKTNFQHVMLDVETLGTKSNAVIISIAAVEFNIATGKTGKDLFQKIDIDSCLNSGLRVDGKTLKWWMDQADEAKKASFSDGINLGYALSCLTNFTDWENKRVWGNSNRFDCGLVENAYNAIGLEAPWNNFKELDCRTLVWLNPTLKNKKNFKGSQHNPLDDCYFQIDYCCKIFNSINVKKEPNNV